MSNRLYCMSSYFWLPVFGSISRGRRRPNGIPVTRAVQDQSFKAFQACWLSLISTFHCTAQKTSSGAWECTSDSQTILPSLPSTLVLICSWRMHVHINTRLVWAAEPRGERPLPVVRPNYRASLQAELQATQGRGPLLYPPVSTRYQTRNLEDQHSCV
jgi:hypothetical protein